MFVFKGWVPDNDLGNDDLITDRTCYRNCHSHQCAASANSSYAAASIKVPASSGLDILILIIQPRPNASSLTVSVASASIEFTSTTSPLTGLYRSETALTDSTVPNTSPLASMRPASGSST